MNMLQRSWTATAKTAAGLRVQRLATEATRETRRPLRRLVVAAALLGVAGGAGVYVLHTNAGVRRQAQDLPFGVRLVAGADHAAAVALHEWAKALAAANRARDAGEKRLGGLAQDARAAAGRAKQSAEATAQSAADRALELYREALRGLGLSDSPSASPQSAKPANPAKTNPAKTNPAKAEREILVVQISEAVPPAAVPAELPPTRPDGAVAVAIVRALETAGEALESAPSHAAVAAARREVARARAFLAFAPEEQAELLQAALAEHSQATAERLQALEAAWRSVAARRGHEREAVFAAERQVLLSTAEARLARELEEQAQALQAAAAEALQTQQAVLQRAWQREVARQLDSERSGRLARLDELAAKVGALDELVGRMAVGIDYQAALLRASNALAVVDGEVARLDASAAAPMAGTTAPRDVDLRVPLSVLARTSAAVGGSAGALWEALVRHLQADTAAGVSSVSALQSGFSAAAKAAAGAAYMPAFGAVALPSSAEKPLTPCDDGSFVAKIPAQSASVIAAYAVSAFVLAPFARLADRLLGRSERLVPASAPYVFAENLADGVPELDSTETLDGVQHWTDLVSAAVEPAAAMWRQGARTESLLRLAAFHLYERRDLDAAARCVSQLRGWPRVLCNDWLCAARQRLELDQALDVVRAHFRLLSVEANLYV